MQRETAICLSPLENKNTSSSDRFPLKPTGKNKTYSFQQMEEERCEASGEAPEVVEHVAPGHRPRGQGGAPEALGVHGGELRHGAEAVVVVHLAGRREPRCVRQNS